MQPHTLYIITDGGTIPHTLHYNRRDGAVDGVQPHTLYIIIDGGKGVQSHTPYIIIDQQFVKSQKQC